MTNRPKWPTLSVATNTSSGFSIPVSKAAWAARMTSAASAALPDFDLVQLLAVHFDIRQTDIATGVEVQNPKAQVGFSKVAVTVVYAQIVQADTERGESLEDA